MTRLTGFSLPSSNFKIIERGVPALDDVWDVLCSSIPCVVVRNFLPHSVCETWLDKAVTFPGEVRNDEVPGLTIGAFHYGKPLLCYLDEVKKSEGILESIASINPDIPHSIYDFVKKSCALKGSLLRRSAHEGNFGGWFSIRQWTDRGEYLLKPHEDAAQRLIPTQAEFEVSKTQENAVCSVNLCIENSGGGNLVIWNIQPDREARSLRGIDFTGYPYEPRELGGFSKIEVGIGVGDLYLFDARYVHAVTRVSTSVDCRRTTVSFLCAALSTQEVISWT